MYISIIIPCYNEEDIIEDNIQRVNEYLKNESKNFSNFSYEILAINDGSSDKTKNILQELEDKLDHFRYFSFEYNQGRGAAMKQGIKLSQGKHVMFLDADLSYDVHHIGLVLNTFKDSPGLDAIIVSPYMKGGVAKNIPISRLALSKTANWILAGFFANKISTVTSMVRAYRGDLIRNIPLYEDGKELHLEILRKLNLVGAKIKEIPGQLIWKEAKKRSGRLNKAKVANAAGKHLLYGFLVKPNRFIGKIAILVLLVGIYETLNVARSVVANFSISNEGIWRDLWLALSKAFSGSPHTTVIAAVSIIVGIQTLSYLALFTVLRLQHEEVLRHVLHLSQDDKMR